MIRFLGIYPFKRSGNSELIPTSKCCYWLTQIIVLIIMVAILVPCIVLYYTDYYTEVTLECRRNATREIDYLINGTISEGLILFTYFIVYGVVLYLYYIFNWRRLAKELSILQKNFNCIEFPYPNQTSSDKMPRFGQHRSKTFIILICIIPWILMQIGNFVFVVGNTMLHSHILSTTTTCSASKPYYIIDALMGIIPPLFFTMPCTYFYIIFVDISHLFLSWSETIVKAQGMQRSTLLSQTLSFIRILNHFNNIISSFIFLLTLALFLMILCEGYGILFTIKLILKHGFTVVRLI